MRRIFCEYGVLYLGLRNCYFKSKVFSRVFFRLFRGRIIWLIFLIWDFWFLDFRENDFGRIRLFFFVGFIMIILVGMWEVLIVMFVGWVILGTLFKFMIIYFLKNENKNVLFIIGIIYLLWELNLYVKNGF